MIIIKLGTTLVYHRMHVKSCYDVVSIGLPNSLISGKKIPLDQFLTALMKLCLKLGDQNLAYRFGILQLQGTVSNYFSA